MVGSQCEQQLYHSSTQLLHPLSQGETGHMFVVIKLINIFSIVMQSSTSEYVLFNQTYLLFSSGPKPTQKQLLQQLYNTVPDKWHPIGVYLEISEGQLNSIDAKHRGDPQKCLMAMLTESWLPRVSPPPTWQEIAEAVEFVGYPNVAHTLRDKFCEFYVTYTVS